MRSRVEASVLAAIVLAVPPAAGAARGDPEAPPSNPAEQRQGTPQPEPAQEPRAQAAAGAQSDAERKKLEEEIARQLGAQPAQPGAAPAAPGGAAPSPAPGGSAIARVLLLPDINVVGQLALAFDSYDVERASPRPELFGPPSKPQPIFQEVELGFQSVVDPYVRADVFGSIGPDGAELEEAYLTTLTLPAGLQVRAGKLFSPFGRQNQQHSHVWDFVDAPLASTRLLADEALSGPGVDVAWLAPVPWFAELHLAGQGTAPAEGDAERLTGIARLLQYFPLGTGTTLGLGLSAGTRDEGGGAFRDLGGVDAYLRWRPTALRSWIALQAELYGRRFRGTSGSAQGGGYAQLFWREGPFFGYGVRYENAPAAGESAPGREHRAGAVATWFPSEFQKYRVQVSWDRRPGGRDGLEALLQAEFVMGSHGAHPF